MANGGKATTMIVINFHHDGTIVVAYPPEGMSAEDANTKAQEIYQRVYDAYEDDYAKYADGKFDTLDAIEKELNAIGANVLVSREDRF